MNYTPVGFDVETKSKCDITKGSYKYSTDPSTDMLMFWIIWPVASPHGISKVYWSPHNIGNISDCTYGELGLPDDFKFVCFNRYFEFCIWNHVLVPKYGFPELPITRFIDAQDQCRIHGIDPSLETACAHLKLPDIKSPEGKRLIQLFCVEMERPEDHPKDWQIFMDYCHDDVVATLGIYEYLPKLTALQQRDSDMVEMINHRGLQLDMYGCECAIELVDQLKTEGNARIQIMTNNVVEKGTQRARVMKWLEGTQGVKMDNMQAGTIVAKLTEDLPELAREMLHIYQVCGKSSVAKLNKFAEYDCDDGRVHNSLIYHGAATGRPTSSGIQFLNLPRPLLPKGTNYEEVVTVIKTGVLGTLKALCDNLALGTDWRPNAMEAILSCIRTMVVASYGKKYYCSDLNAIEARIAVWIAGEEFAIQDYIDGIDPYKQMIADTLGISIEEVTDLQRFMGKEGILSCQFGTGWKSYKKNLKQKHNVDIEAKMAKKVVNGYRSKYTKVMAAHKIFGDAAIKALKKRGVMQKALNCAFIFEDKFLYCILPSGRRIAYPYPMHSRIAQVWDEKNEEYRNPRASDDDKKIVMLDNITYLKKVEHKWVRGKTYGGSLFQSAVQATGADIINNCLCNVDAAGYPPVLSVYDEALCEVDEDFGSVLSFETHFLKKEKWYHDLPMKCETWVGLTYRK